MREALSAQLDGEEPGIVAADLTAHLAGCPGCREFRARSATIHRALRVRIADPVPDLSEAILNRDAGRRRRIRRQDLARWALVFIAFCMVDMGLAQLLGVDTIGDAPGYGQHLFNESTAWSLALAAGFLAGAWRPRLIAGQLTPIAGFVGVLIVVSATDLVGGHVEPARLLMHLPILAGLALMFVVHRGHRRLTGPAEAARAADSRLDTTTLEQPDAPTAIEETGKPTRHLKPAGRVAA